MNKNIKIITTITVLVFIGGLCWLFQGEKKIQQLDQEEETPLMMSYIGNTLSEEKNGKKVWELNADLIEIDPVSKNTILKNIKGVFYQNNGENITLTAPKAVYDVESRNITITEKVQAVSSNGATLNAEQVIWDSGQERFEGKGNIKLKQGDTIITGDKLESNNGFSKFKVIGNAHIVKGGK